MLKQQYQSFGRGTKEEKLFRVREENKYKQQADMEDYSLFPVWMEAHIVIERNY